jgi:hypothetical protein
LAKRITNALGVTLDYLAGAFITDFRNKEQYAMKWLAAFTNTKKPSKPSVRTRFEGFISCNWRDQSATGKNS